MAKRLLKVLNILMPSPLSFKPAKSSHQAHCSVIHLLPPIPGATPLVQITMGYALDHSDGPWWGPHLWFTSLHSVLQVAARVIFLKCNSGQAIPFFKILQWVPSSP